MTERQRQRQWRKTQAKRDRFAKAMAREWRVALMGQIEPVLKEIDPSTVDSIEARIPALIREDLIEAQLMRNISLVGAYFAGAAYRNISKAYAPQVTHKADEIPKDEEWVTSVLSTLGQKAGVRITAITDESRAQAIAVVQQTLQQAAEEGMGTSQMSVLLRDNMKEHWGDISTYRAARIARTETTMASNLGSLTGAIKTGEPMLKVWLSTRDSRTRRGRGRNNFDHYGTYPAGPDGEKAELNKDFQKTGEPLEHPGDYKGSAGNVIHCRCTMFYEPIETDL